MPLLKGMCNTISDKRWKVPPSRRSELLYDVWSSPLPRKSNYVPLVSDPNVKLTLPPDSKTPTTGAAASELYAGFQLYDGLSVTKTAIRRPRRPRQTFSTERHQDVPFFLSFFGGRSPFVAQSPVMCVFTSQFS